MTARLRPAFGAGLLAVALAVTPTPASALPDRPGPARPAPERPAPPRPAPQAWTPVELGTLGGESTVPTAVSDRGQVVGRSQVADGRWHAFLWDDGVMTDLTPDAQQGSATDVSNGAAVSGWVQPAPGESSDGFVWSRGRTAVVVDGGSALAVNARGQVGGVVDETATTRENPFVWTAGTRVDLPPPPFPGAFGVSSLVDLNDKGVVLGRGEFDDDTDLVYLWSRGRFTELRDARGDVLRGVDLNDRGHVAGVVWNEARAREAALWRRGQIVRIGALPGATWTEAAALNESDVVVGTSAAERGRPGTGFVWRSGVLTAIDDGDGWSTATAVNDRGQVAGVIGDDEVAQPFVWKHGRLVRLGTPTAEDVAVVDLSETGHVLTTTGDFRAQTATLWLPKPR
ncbi:hypothetical protein [Cellulomonas palmilytica]|uniref:hypothetical protein n=1 Tax=Cellulomonas palmilytica TaxID=2608402 RepID=UPI001F3618A3|nr:hypothetical protein [Cellulomonas palmilytica]UJP40321.1 hypothetical protein F1D97_01950 [Cellulomonas palmilytica]